MTAIGALPQLTVSPTSAVQAYARASSPEGAGGGDGGFGAALGRAVEGLVAAGSKADHQATKLLSGTGNLTEMALAVSHAELALQGAVAIRDKVVSAYQDIMRMPI